MRTNSSGNSAESIPSNTQCFSRLISEIARSGRCARPAIILQSHTMECQQLQ